MPFSDRSAEDQLQKERRRMRQASLEAETRKQKEMNELLELRSLGVRTAMKALDHVYKPEDKLGEVGKKEVGQHFC
jgi:hypothetical protein